MTVVRRHLVYALFWLVPSLGIAAENCPFTKLVGPLRTATLLSNADGSQQALVVGPATTLGHEGAILFGTKETGLPLVKYAGELIVDGPKITQANETSGSLHDRIEKGISPDDEHELGNLVRFIEAHQEVSLDPSGLRRHPTKTGEPVSPETEHLHPGLVGRHAGRNILNGTRMSLAVFKALLEPKKVEETPSSRSVEILNDTLFPPDGFDVDAFMANRSQVEALELPAAKEMYGILDVTGTEAIPESFLRRADLLLRRDLEEKRKALSATALGPPRLTLNDAGRLLENPIARLEPYLEGLKNDGLITNEGASSLLKQLKALASGDLSALKEASQEFDRLIDRISQAEATPENYIEILTLP